MQFTILFIVLVIAGVVLYFSFQYRFKKIVECLDLLKTTVTAQKPASYKVEVTISPNWAEVVKWYFPKLKTEKEAWKFIAKFFDNPKVKIDESQSLYGKRFSFVEYYDGISGLNPIWSYHYKKFMSDREISGWLLKDEKGLGGILSDEFDIENKDGEYISDSLEISPCYIATDQEYGSSTISAIPYHDIVSFFLKIYQETGSTEWQVKKFPMEIQKYFDEAKVTYEPSLDTHMGDLEPVTDLFESKSKWIEESGTELYRQRVRYHTFKTSYFEISMKLEFFSPDDIRPWNGVFEV